MNWDAALHIAVIFVNAHFRTVQRKHYTIERVPLVQE